MNSNQFKDIVTSLIQKGVEVEQDALQVAQSKLALKSIIIRVISVIGSLIGLGLFMGFIALISSDLFSNNTFLSIMGLLFLVGSFALNRSKDSAVTDSIAVSLFIIGYAFLVFGLAEATDLAGLIMLITGGITLLLYNNQIIAFLSSLCVLVSIHVILFQLEIETFYHIYLAIVLLFTVYLFWQEQGLRTINKLIRDRYLAVFTASFCYTLVMGIIASTMKYGYYYFSEYRGVHLFLVITILALVVATVYLVLNKMKVTQVSIKVMAYGLVLIFNVLVAFNYPAFGIAFLLMLWSFKRQYKVGFALSIATLIWAMGMFYYDLGIFLLEKSLSMMTIGVLFLGIYYLIQKGEGQTNEK